MDSSSENSFTWTDTSSDSTDSNPITVDESLLELIKREKIINGSKLKSNEHKKNTISDENMVKIEPESDCDIPKKRKKSKHIKVEVNGDQKKLCDSNSYDESYLDLKVKQEDVAENKKRKKRNLSESVDGHQSDTTKPRVKDATPEFNAEIDTESKRKKKKKKSKRKSENESQEELQYKKNEYCDTDNKLENISQSNKYANKIEENSITENTFENESCYEISAIQCEDHNLHTLSFDAGENRNHSLYKTAITNQIKVDNNNEAQVIERNTPRLSDRIRFEDESDMETSDYNHSTGDKTSLKLNKYLNSSKDMKVISQQLSNSCMLTCDDEIWILHCPKEVGIEHFNDADLNMNGKNKIKVGGQTYDGSLDNEGCDTTAVLTMEHGKYHIKSIPLSGIITFRKRIPKAHFHDSNVMVNNQTNFIPLPETKCRHPLFGSNYKKALKIPSAVAQQLKSQQEPEDSLSAEKRKKKKRKRDMSFLKQETSDCKFEVGDILETEQVLNKSEKKKKKRKHTDDEGPASKRIKKMKHDPESAEAWESEKAIEQNLFSF